MLTGTDVLLQHGAAATPQPAEDVNVCKLHVDEVYASSHHILVRFVCRLQRCRLNRNRNLLLILTDRLENAAKVHDDWRSCRSTQMASALLICSKRDKNKIGKVHDPFRSFKMCRMSALIMGSITCVKHGLTSILRPGGGALPSPLLQVDGAGLASELRAAAHK